MKEITRNIVGPESKVYKAKFQQAENANEYAEVIAALALTLAEVNEALRKAKKASYLAALESTPDSIIAEMYATMVKGGFTPEEAQTLSESRRSKLGTGIPVGLESLNRTSKRGKKDKTEEAKPEAESQSKTPAPKKNGK